MTPNALWAGALSLLLSHNETGCPKSARQAADLLDRLADDPALDRETRSLCARASDRLGEGCLAPHEAATATLCEQANRQKTPVRHKILAKINANDYHICD